MLESGGFGRKLAEKQQGHRGEEKIGLGFGVKERGVADGRGKRAVRKLRGLTQIRGGRTGMANSEWRIREHGGGRRSVVLRRRFRAMRLPRSKRAEPGDDPARAAPPEGEHDQGARQRQPQRTEDEAS